MVMPTKVSFIVPCFNAEPVLPPLKNEFAY